MMSTMIYNACTWVHVCVSFKREETNLLQLPVSLCIRSHSKCHFILLIDCDLNQKSRIVHDGTGMNCVMDISNALYYRHVHMLCDAGPRPKERACRELLECNYRRACGEIDL